MGNADEKVAKVPHRVSFNTSNKHQIRKFSRRTVVKVVDDDDKPSEVDIYDVISLDGDVINETYIRAVVGRLLANERVKMFIWTLIAIDVLLVSFRTNTNMAIHHNKFVTVFDDVLLTILIGEIILKLYVDWILFWMNLWNVEDVVTNSLLLLTIHVDYLNDERMRCVLKIVRAFRLISIVSSRGRVYVAVKAILQSIPGMVNICLLLAIFSMMFAVLGAMVFGKEASQSFGGLQSALYSLFVCVTQDGWLDIYKEFKAMDDQLMFIFGAIFLVVVITIASIVFANLIVAVVVTKLEQAVREMKSKDPDTKGVQDILTFGSSADVPLVPLSDVLKEGSLSDQIPVQLTDLRKLQPEDLERYYLILSALEDNLAEYLNIKNDLLKIFQMVRDTNLLMSQRRQLKGRTPAQSLPGQTVSPGVKDEIHIAPRIKVDKHK